MDAKVKAKEIFEKYLGIIGTNCEHNCYCDREECNKLGYTFCHVDYKTAKACAIEEVKAVIEENKSVFQMLERHGSERSMLPVRFRIQDLEQLLTEIEKL